MFRNNDQNDDADWLVGTKSPDEATFQQHFGPYDVMPGELTYNSNDN